MATIYERQRQADSDRAHLAAQRDIYPRFFGVVADRIEYESYAARRGDFDRWLDADLSIDMRLGIRLPDYRRPLPFYFQERFRDPVHMRWGDVTITEWSKDTDQPNELYKIAADYFTYGYYDKHGDRFLDWLVFNVPSVKRALVLKELRLHEAPDNTKRQAVVGIKLTALERYGMRMAHPPVAPGLLRTLIRRREEPSTNGEGRLFLS